MKEIGKQIGLKIREARISKGLTQNDLAKKIGTDKSYIGHLENGLKVPSLKMLEKMSSYLNVPYSYFFDDAISIDTINRLNPKIKRIIDKISKKSDKKLDFISGFIDLVGKV